MSLAALPANSRSLLLAASVGVASLVALGLVTFAASGDSSEASERKQGKRRHGRRRRQKVHLRGLYNLGNTCFMNSTLQSLASLSVFNDYVDNCVASLSANSQHTVEAGIAVQLKQVLDLLAPQASRVAAHAPRALIHSLSQRSRWVSSRSEQDAQELFQMLSSTLRAIGRDADTSLFDSGFLSRNPPLMKRIISTPQQTSSEMSPEPPASTHTDSSAPSFDSPLLGMAASRIACVRCGYTAAIRHFTFDNISLSVPRVRRTTVEECLAVYTAIDQLDDFKCRQCTLRATVAQMKQGVDKCKADLAARERAPKPARRLASEAASLSDQLHRCEVALANDPEVELKGIRLVSPPPGVSTKQTMIARAPRVLVLHLSRSIFLPTGGTAKNPAHVQLKRFLDISPFATTGHISTNASAPISGAASPFATESLAQVQRRNCLYRLCGVVVHSGSHDSGHFYAYRRVKSDDVDEDSADADLDPTRDATGRWFMVSDIRAVEVSLDSVLDAGDAYLLFYERV